MTSTRTRLFTALAACFVAFAAVSLWGTTRGQHSRYGQNDAARVENKTQSLQVLSISVADIAGPGTPTLKITMLNISNKGIVDYVFLKKDGSTTTTSGATTGWWLAPGETDTFTMPVGPDEEVLTLSAVLSEDGTGEGNPQEVSEMKEYRAGVGKQFARLVPLLQRAKNAPQSARARVVLEDLKKQVSALPDESVGPNIPRGMSSGLRHAKQFVLTQLKSSENELKGADDAAALQVVQTDVDKVLRQVEKALSKLQR